MIAKLLILIAVIFIAFIVFLWKNPRALGRHVKYIHVIIFASALIVFASSSTALALHFSPNLSPVELIDPFSTLKKTLSISMPNATQSIDSDGSSQKKTETKDTAKSSGSPKTENTKTTSPTPTPTSPSSPSTPSQPSQPSEPIKPTPPPPSSPWSQDMVEDFSSSLSSSRWSIRNNTYSSNEDSYLLSRNVSVGAGALRIQGKLESAGGRNYTSGYIDTIGKYSLPNYFKAEIRAKVPMQQGMWAAPLWFRPEGGGDGEIDLVETLGSERSNPKIHQTIHTEYGSTHKQSAVTTSFSAVSSSSATDWHVYTIEKTKDKMVMWVDGVQTAQYTPTSPSWYSSYYEAGKRWNLRVNLQIGGTWGGLPDGSTNWSGDNTAMQLDYIHTWVLK